MVDWRDDRIRSAAQGNNPLLVAEMQSGYAVMADMQFLPGWCILLPKSRVPSLNSLSIAQRSRFLLDMSIIGDAVNEVCASVRVNYDILGNTDQYLHAHIYPRYDWEPESRLKLPVWLYDAECWSDPKSAFDSERHGAMMRELREYLLQHMTD